MRDQETCWASDGIAELLRALDIPYLALTPGSSFRGLHDSVVNHLGDEAPQHILAIHEESAVAIAHGFAKAAGRPMAAALHANVGLMHASMAIFNAWCDRTPVLLLGAQGPVDAEQRRPFVDWLHTCADLGALVRPFTKWDNQPHSLPAALEAILRAHQSATTAPCGPVFVSLDQSLQESRAPRAHLPRMQRVASPVAPEPAPECVADIAQRLQAAARPLVLVGRVSGTRADWDRRVAFAEAFGVPVLTDLKTGARFPTRHPLHPVAPGLSASPDALALIRQSDLILSLDWIDLGGTLLQAFAAPWPEVDVVECSLDPYVHNGWSMDHQALPAADLALRADPDRLVARLLALRPEGSVPRTAARAPGLAAAREEQAPGSELGIEQLARGVLAALEGQRPSFQRLPIGWPGHLCDFRDPLDYLGYDGAGGIGSGPGMSVGGALALRGSGRLPVAVLGDGDFLMGLTAVWSAVHHRIPLLLVVANNRSFFNDELHQERMARQRHRPVENRGIGIQIDDPAPDLAQLARGQGAAGFGPVQEALGLAAALEEALVVVRRGGVAVVDVRVKREYGRGIPAQVLRTAREPHPAGASAA